MEVSKDCFYFCPDTIDDAAWYRRFGKYFGADRQAAIARGKPAVVPWFIVFIKSMNWPATDDEWGADHTTDAPWSVTRLSAAHGCKCRGSSGKGSTAGESPPLPSAGHDQCLTPTKCGAFSQWLGVDEVLQFCAQVRQIHHKYAGDSLSLVQELVLDNDLETAVWHIDRELDRHQSTYDLMKEKSVLQFAALARSVAGLSFLLKRGARPALNTGDVVSGFTPLHMSMVCGSSDCFQFLLLQGADFAAMDKVRATAADYGRLLGLLPSVSPVATDTQLVCQFVDTQSSCSSSSSSAEGGSTDAQPSAPKLRWLTRSEFRTLFPNLTFCTQTLGSLEYILELMFSGVSIETKETEFRNKHLPLLLQKTFKPDSGATLRAQFAKLFLAHTGDNRLGYGLFAATSIAPGSLICAYGGLLRSADRLKDRSYAVASGLDGVLLDAGEYRSLAGFANHSAREPNAELQGAFASGAERVALIAVRQILPGQQIVFNYESSFFDSPTQQQGGEDDDFWSTSAEDADNNANTALEPPSSGLTIDDVVEIDPDKKFLFSI